MRRFLTGLLMLAATPFLTGCSTTASNTTKGAGIGGLLGAGTGAAIGSANGKTGQGALIGGLIGTGVGALIGNDVDQQEKAVADDKARQAEAAARAMTVDEVIRLTEAQTPEGVIINQIRSTRSVFQLTTADLEKLQANRVAPNVIMEMQNSRSVVYPARPQYHRGPPPPVYIVPAPPPPPPPGFGVYVQN